MLLRRELRLSARLRGLPTRLDRIERDNERAHVVEHLQASAEPHSFVNARGSCPPSRRDCRPRRRLKRVRCVGRLAHEPTISSRKNVESITSKVMILACRESPILTARVAQSRKRRLLEANPRADGDAAAGMRGRWTVVRGHRSPADRAPADLMAPRVEAVCVERSVDADAQLSETRPRGAQRLVRKRSRAPRLRQLSFRGA